MIITTYLNPDIDGVSCCIAYSEFLRKKGLKAKACICGHPNLEAKFVLDKFKVKSEGCADFLNEQIVIVDMSKPEDLCSKIDPKQVVEIIDHRKYTKLGAFQNAKSQIELVGSCATLIAEKYKSEKIEVKKEYAGLLYSAIVSNTINFKNNVTTKRDIAMAKWLNEKLGLDERYTREMFEFKSRIKDIKKALIDDFVEYQDFNVGIAQLEIIAAEKFVGKHIQEVKKVLSEIKSERKLEYIFLTAIDVIEGYNIFVCVDDKSQKILSPLKINFKDNIAKRDGIIMRKEIVPLIKELFNKK